MGFQRATRRSAAPAAALAAAGLVACGPVAKPAIESRSADITAPARRSGLWEQTIAQDGKTGHAHGIQICLDDSRASRPWVFSDTGQSDRCQRQISRGPDGAYRFASTCRLGAEAMIKSTGVITGDFVSRYEVRSVLTVTGAPLAELDGRHAIALVARYRGACPAGMTPGQVSAGGMKTDVRRLQQLASAFAGA